MKGSSSNHVNWTQMGIGKITQERKGVWQDRKQNDSKAPDHSLLWKYAVTCTQSKSIQNLAQQLLLRDAMNTQSILFLFFITHVYTTMDTH